jgi:hypothetical protein
MNTETNTLTSLKNTLAARRQAKFNKARLAVRKAWAMQDNYGFTASLPFWVEARDLYDSAARLYKNPTPWEVMKTLA